MAADQGAPQQVAAGVTEGALVALREEAAAEAVAKRGARAAAREEAVAWAPAVLAARLGARAVAVVRVVAPEGRPPGEVRAE